MTISEGSTNDELLEVVNATDDDSGTNGAITYAIVGGNVNNAFYIKTPSVSELVTILFIIDNFLVGRRESL